MSSLAKAGSQRWLQIAVNKTPDPLLAALRRAHAIGPRATVAWHSPLQSDGFKEYRDHAALARAGLDHLHSRTLSEFWPARGPVWDAIGTASDGSPIFVEAKAHVPEAASPACRASAGSMLLIQRSLAEARRSYAPKATADWHGLFYQYANRLAHQYLVRRVNGIQSALVFLYFVNADDMHGPTSEAEWKGAIRLIHAALGLPAHLESHGVFDAFVDVRLLTE
jgi:hypothetical protein